MAPKEAEQGGLEANIGILARNIAIGSHWYDELPQVNKLNQMLNLGLSDEGIKELQLDLIFRSLLIATSKEHLQTPGYTHLSEKSLKKMYANGLFDYGFVSTLGEAKKLVNKGLDYYRLMKETNVPRA